MTSEIKLTVDVNQKSITGQIYCKQGDGGGRIIAVQFSSNGAPVALGDDCTVVMRCQRPDHCLVEIAGAIENNTARFEITRELTASPGNVLADVSILDTSGNVTSSCNFTIYVERQPAGSELLPVGDTYKLNPARIATDGTQTGFVLVVNGVGDAVFADATHQMTLDNQDFFGVIEGVFG